MYKDLYLLIEIMALFRSNNSMLRFFLLLSYKGERLSALRTLEREYKWIVIRLCLPNGCKSWNTCESRTEFQDSCIILVLLNFEIGYLDN